MSTIILGGGIIGLSTAYYLSRDETSSLSAKPIHIIDSSPSLLLSASGFAGGFLAADWFSGAVAPLGALSFRLHRELADKHDGRRKWGYSASTAYSLSIEDVGVGGKPGKKARGKDWLLEGTSRSTVAATLADVTESNGNGNGGRPARDEMLNEDGTPAWITQQPGGSLETISSEGGCAQLEPRELCDWLMEQCEEAGVKIHLSSRATGLVQDTDGVVRALKVQHDDDSGKEEIELDCANIIIASGAWTPRVFQSLFPTSKTRIPIDSLAGHSIVVRSPRYSRPIVDPKKHNANHSEAAEEGICHSIFCAPGPHWTFAPEAISRLPKSGKPEIYVAGLNSSSMPLPERASDVKAMMDQESMEALKMTTVNLAGLSNENQDDLNEDDLEVVRQGLCFRPVSSSGKPIVTRLPDKDLGQGVKMASGAGVFVAAGHGPWGISLSLGTGLVVSEMVCGRKPSIEVRGLGLR